MVQNSGFTMVYSHPDLDGRFAAFGKSIARSLLKQETYGGQKMPYLSQPRFHIRLYHQNVISKQKFDPNNRVGIRGRPF